MAKPIDRRRFLRRLALYGTPLVVLGDAGWIEPHWLKVNQLRFTEVSPVARFVHFTDLHHKGDRKWLASIVDRIKALKPEFVCFTGDLIEDQKHLSEALELLKGLDVPLFGVPGNHDYWSRADFKEIARAFAVTGGAWLMDESASAPGGKVRIHGLTCETCRVIAPEAGVKNLLLAHYPEWCEKVAPHRYDLMLAGHSHGGQVRIPFYGAVIVPYGVGKYELGHFDTPAGPLYVGSGIGYFYLNFRFRCRPEITLVEI